MGDGVGVGGDKDIGLGGGLAGGAGGLAAGADDAGSKGGWMKEEEGIIECGVDTVGERDTLCALSGGFSASSLRIIASVPRRTGVGAARTVTACTSCWDTRDVVRGRSRWFVWSASRIGSNVGIGDGQSW